MSNSTQTKVVKPRHNDDPIPRLDRVIRAELTDIRGDGLLVVRCADGRELLCECLEAAVGREGLCVGDRVLALLPAGSEPGVVCGRIGRYRAPEPAAPSKRVTIEATETLSLKCGESTVDLRADGKVMIRGEDVLVRARRTQRIKAGTVNIN